MEYDIQPSPRAGMGALHTPIPGYLSTDWRPELIFGTSNTGMTGTIQALYTRIGNRIFFDCLFNLTSKGSSVGQAYITGLPQPVWGNNPPAPIYWIAMTTPLVFMLGIPGGTGIPTDIYLAGSAAATSTVSALTDADFSNSTQFVCTGNYAIGYR